MLFSLSLSLSLSVMMIMMILLLLLLLLYLMNSIVKSSFFSTGCVERGNGDMEVKLGKWMETHEQEWSRGLEFIAHAINTSVSSTTGKSPCHLVFGQRPRSDCTVWEELARQGIGDEESFKTFKTKTSEMICSSHKKEK